MLSNLKNDGIPHIVSEPWRACISLYKNVVVAHIFLYKNTYSTLSLAIANDQITSFCRQILMQGVVMVVYGSKLIRMEEIVLSLHQPFLLPVTAIAKPLCFLLRWKFCIAPFVGGAKLSTRLEEKCTCNYWNCQYGCICEEKFGILTNRWCLFLSTILLPNESVRSLMHATIVLIANQES